MVRAAAYLAGLCSRISHRLASRDAGATTVEYGFLVGLLAVVVVMAATMLRGHWGA